MHAAHAIDGPTYAHVTTTTDALIAELGAGAKGAAMVGNSAAAG